MARLSLPLAAIFSLVSLPGTGLAAEAPDFAGALPVQVGEWKKPAQPMRYDGKSLYDYIDGGAELYRAFGFVTALAFEYEADGDDVIKVDIFDMGSARGAFGVFAHGRETVAAEIGQGSEYAAGLLTLWKGRWFVSVLGYPETPAKRAAVYELGRAVAALVSETGRPPPIVEALPKPGLIEASVRTFHHPLLQNDYLTISYDNPLRIGPDTDAVLARYARQGERHLLLLVEYPSVAEAAKARRSFITLVLHGTTPAKHGPRWAGVKRSGRRLAIVLDVPARQTVHRLLSEVP
jgi:hypothetical protein